MATVLTTRSLDDATLKEMVERASASEKFVVRVSDIRPRRALSRARSRCPSRSSRKRRAEEKSRSGEAR